MLRTRPASKEQNIIKTNTNHPSHQTRTSFLDSDLFSILDYSCKEIRNINKIFNQKYAILTNFFLLLKLCVLFY